MLHHGVAILGAAGDILASPDGSGGRGFRIQRRRLEDYVAALPNQGEEARQVPIAAAAGAPADAGQAQVAAAAAPVDAPAAVDGAAAIAVIAAAAVAQPAPAAVPQQQEPEQQPAAAADQEADGEQAQPARAYSVEEEIEADLPPAPAMAAAVHDAGDQEQQEYQAPQEALDDEDEEDDDGIAEPGPASRHEQDDRARTEARQVARARKMVAMGKPVKAARILNSSKPISTADAEIRERLKALHPQGPSAEDLERQYPFPRLLPQNRRPTVLTSSNIKAALQNASATGPGLSGWTADHLLALVDDEVIMNGLTRFVQDTANAQIPRELHDYLIGSNLQSFAKDRSGDPQLGVRPVVIPEIFYRLAAHLLSDKNQDVMVAAVGDSQFGIGYPGGAQAVKSAVESAMVESTAEMAALAIDFKNAFNNVSRAAMFRELGKNPSLAGLWPFVWYSYGRHGKLYVEDAQHRRVAVEGLSSQQGSRQGDPIGGFLFSLVLAHWLKLAKERFPDVTFLAYFDDLTVLSRNPADLKSVFEFLQGAAVDGLVINASKTQLYRTPGQAAALSDLSADLTAWLASTGIRSTNDQLVVLGGCISTDGDKVEHFCQQVADDTEQLFRLASHQNMPAVTAMKILAYSAAPRMTYILRTHRPEATQEAAHAFRDKMILAAQQKLALTDAELSQQCRNQLHLPARMGGFGLPNTPDIAPIAWLGGQAAAAPLIARVRGELKLDIKQDVVQASAAVVEDVRLKCSLTAENPISQFVPVDGSITPFFIATREQYAKSLSQLQRILTVQYNKSKLATMHSLARRQATKVRLTALTAPLAGLWITAAPRTAPLTFKTQEYRLMARYRLGLGPSQDKSFDVPPSERCQLCRGVMASSWHGLECLKLRGSLGRQRHDRISQLLYSAAVGAGIAAEREVREFEENRKRPDLLFSSLNSLTMFADVAVVSPLAKSHQNRAKRVLGAAAHGEVLKRQKYHEEISRLRGGATFVPFIVESLGGFGHGARNVIRHIVANYNANTATMARPDVQRRLRYEVAVALQKGNAAIMVSWLQRTGQILAIDQPL